MRVTVVSIKQGIDAINTCICINALGDRLNNAMTARDDILRSKKTSLPSTNTPTFTAVRHLAQTSYFGMNEVACLVFGARRFHVTSGLNGCFGLFLVSASATVSAHIPPRPDLSDDDPQAGDKNMLAKLQEFARLYQTNEKHFSSYNKEFIEKYLRRLKVDFPIQYYDVKRDREARSEKHGTAFVDGGQVNGAAVYLEDRPIMRVLKSASDQSNQMAVPQESYYANPIFPRPSTAPASNPNDSSEQSEQRRK
ncbi:hypothetical protein LTS15_010091 [Exophiala xenobiotica]|nr:hypothetical protein LTS15_010091 [Exophiala xenobiotica]